MNPFYVEHRVRLRFPLLRNTERAAAAHVGELKDRNRELNDMVAVHQRQLLSWEEDRQKVTLEERCSKLRRSDIFSTIHLVLVHCQHTERARVKNREGTSQHSPCCPRFN